MNLKHSALTLSLMALSVTIAHAAPPKVAVDIAPLHSLVSQVMDGVGKAELIIPPESSPHEYSLRPSQAKALAKANLVFWMSGELTPWLEKALNNISESATKLEMLEVEGTVLHAFREGSSFEGHDHDHANHHKDHHDEHEEDHHDEHHKDHHDKHEEDHHDEHEGADPHAWLDPENAKTWIKLIANQLSEKDSENASAYSKNASAAIDRLNRLITETQKEIDTLNNPKFIVFHDAYQYFEKRFGISAAGSISLGDAQDPSPARIKEIQTTVKNLGVSCAFSEPQYNAGLVHNVFEGSTVTAIGVMDPLGSQFKPGKDHYDALIRSMVSSMKECK